MTGLSGTDKWFGGVLAPNGRIQGIPQNSTSVLIIGTGLPNGSLLLDFLLGAYVNKF